MTSMDRYMNSYISFGAGVNSVAMTILLINNGWRGPIVFSDTGCEWPETYEYMDLFERDWLEPRGFEIIKIKGLPYQTYSNGISLLDYCQKAKLIPFMKFRWCTEKWKVLPLKRWAKKNGKIHTLIGISDDESHRSKNLIYPLCDLHIPRKGCIKIIKAENLLVPRKSGCYICPFQGHSEWRRLWKLHPGLFDRARQLEKSAKRKDKDNPKRILFDGAGKNSLRELGRQFEAQPALMQEIDNG